MREFLITFAKGEDQVEIIHWFVSGSQYGHTADSFASMMQSCLGSKLSDCSAGARQYIQDVLITEADTVGDPSGYSIYSVEER